MDQPATAPTPATTDDTVELTIPLGHRHVSTARLVAASVGADAGLDVDQIDDLKLAVDEAVAVVVDAAGDHGRVVVRFAPQGSAVSVTVSLDADDQPALSRAAIDPLALRILDAVADGFDVADGALVITKRATAGDGG